MAQRILVFSGKGGVGKSSVTVMLGEALASVGKKVLLIDADAGFRSLDLLMNEGTEVVFNWLDVIEESCDAGSAVVSAGEGSPALLGAPQVLAGSVTQESFGRLLSLYDGYDYIIIDSPAGSGSFHDILFKLCGNALAVVLSDPISVRSAAAVCDRAREVNPDIDIRLIVNRFIADEVFSGLRLNLDSTVDGVSARLIGVIPEDDSIRFISSGAQAVKYAKDAFLRIAKRICGESLPLKAKDFY